VGSFSPSNKNIVVEINSGNNQSSFSNNLTHIYSEPGTYLASVKVKDSENKVATRFAYILVGGNIYTQISAIQQDISFKWSYTHGILQLLFNENSLASQISCYEISGQLLVVKNVVGLNESIDLSSYPSGIKIIKVAGNNGSKTFKIIN
jgi:hypothetical protein